MVYMSTPRVIVFDIETIPQPGATSFDALTQDITVVGIHDSKSGTYRCFEVEELPELWKILEQSDILVGYNSDHFDIPVLNRYYPGDLTLLKSVDILKEIARVLGRRVRLNAVATGTLGAKKSGDGLEAQEWWRQGEKEKVKSYCLKDVELTKKIFDFALENSAVKYEELGKIQEVSLNTGEWLSVHSSAMTRTFGF